MAMFDAIEARIKTNPSSFITLLGILSSDSQLQIFAGQLRQCNGECYSLEYTLRAPRAICCQN